MEQVHASLRRCFQFICDTVTTVRFEWLLMVWCVSGAARAAECDDAYTECKDECVITYGGSVKVDVKRQYDKCIKKCAKTASRCVEREYETRSNSLDEGALDKSPASDEVDSDRMPTRTTRRPKKKNVAEPGGEEDDAPAKRHDDLSDAEVPKSNRTTLKAEEEAPPKKEAPPKAEASPKAEEKPKVEEKPAAEPPKERAAEPEPVKEPEPAPPPKKKEEKPPPPPKKEDDDDLRNY